MNIKDRDIQYKPIFENTDPNPYENKFKITIIVDTFEEHYKLRQFYNDTYDCVTILPIGLLL